MATPVKKYETADLNTIAAATVGSCQPWQLKAVLEALKHINYGNRGSQSDMSNQPTITQIVTLLGTTNP